MTEKRYYIQVNGEKEYLDDDEVFFLIKTGLQTIQRASTIRSLGHTTLKGHLYYLRDENINFIDAVLCFLSDKIHSKDKYMDIIDNVLSSTCCSSLLMKTSVLNRLFNN